MKLKFSLLIYLIILFTTMSCEAQTYDEKLQSLYSGTVPLIQVEELENWQKSGREFNLLDTRSSEEYEVSHIEGASLIDYDAFRNKDVENLDKSKPVVLYCSVGYRSEKIGEKLKKAGFREVYNLYGGIFQWKNKDKIVVTQEGQVTDSVHTYNRNWGKWLNKGVKVY